MAVWHHVQSGCCIGLDVVACIDVLSIWRSLCRKTCLLPEEVLQSVYIPFTGAHEYVGEYKQSHKRDDDLAVGNAAFRVLLEPATPGVRHYAVRQRQPTAALFAVINGGQWPKCQTL